MSTMYLSIHDLLCITYTYGARAVERESRSRSSSSSSASSTCSRPNSITSPPYHTIPETRVTADYSALETDFTHTYAKNKMDSCMSM
ncbi:hypothetical protein K504DRAFT_468641, partial [Pleomassaria siparia CBS 279.74]